MISLKTTLLGCSLSLAAVPAVADAVMVDALAEKSLGLILSAKMNSDANAHLYNIPVGEIGVIDTTLGAHDADYEVVLAGRGQATGAAIYGQNDADYDAFLTPANFFATAALGSYDADYEVVLESRKPMGSDYFDKNIDFAVLTK